jgi:hypothetical protein
MSLFLIGILVGWISAWMCNIILERGLYQPLSINDTTEEIVSIPLGVLAGNYRQYVDYCRENYLTPNGVDTFYISNVNSVRGRRGFKVVTYGTYYEREDLRKIQLELRRKVINGDCIIEGE